MMTLFITTFFAVFLLSFQQQNITHRKYGWAAVTAFLIAFSQFYLFKGVVYASNFGWVFMGLGGMAGVLLSMWVHERLVTLDGIIKEM